MDGGTRAAQPVDMSATNAVNASERNLQMVIDTIATATVRTPALEARVLAKTQKPPDGSTHWTTRKLGKVLGLSDMLVARIWRRAGYQPHRFERSMLSDDPQFEQKAADVIGLYLQHPQHAVVFAVDEKTAIQALDRLDPVLPLSPGRAERHGF